MATLRNWEFWALWLGLGVLSFLGGWSGRWATTGEPPASTTWFIWIGVPLIAIGAVGVVVCLLLDLTRTDAVTGDRQEHEQKLRGFADHLARQLLHHSLRDDTAEERLNRESLRSHYPNLAKLEDVLRDYVAEKADARRALEARIARDAETTFASAPANVSNLGGPVSIMRDEAKGLIETGKPHYDDKIIVERGSSGLLWFGAYGIDHWHDAEQNGDLDAIRHDLMDVLGRISEWEEVKQSRLLLTPPPEIHQYEEMLVRIANVVSLAGHCDLCS